VRNRGRASESVREKGTSESRRGREWGKVGVSEGERARESFRGTGSAAAIKYLDRMGII
jgi:hypothetical protein